MIHLNSNKGHVRLPQTLAYIEPKYLVVVIDETLPKQSGRQKPAAFVFENVSNVRAASTDQDVYDVVTALYERQDYPLIGVRRENRVRNSRSPSSR